MLTSSSQRKKRNILALNDSPNQKSIISQIPFPNESIDVFQKIQSLNSQVERLTHELTFYKKESNKQKTGGFQSKSSGSRVYHLQLENQELKGVIQTLSEKLRQNKSQNQYGDEGLMAECEKLQIQNDRYREQILRKTREIRQLQNEIAELKRANRRSSDIVDIQRQELNLRNKETGGEELKLKNLELEYKITELNSEINQNMREIDSLNTQLQKMRKQNVIDRQSRINKRSYEYLKINDGSKSRYSAVSHSRVSELQQLDIQRLQLKITEKNKQYELLYAKYQHLETQFIAIEEANQELMNEQKMLQQKLSNFQIHAQGDQMVGQLQNKLVLMSTQLMRLGHMSRMKVQQNKELNIKIKELIMRNQHLEKDVIERDKIVLNYKEEIRLLEMRMGDIQSEQSRFKEDQDQHNKERIAKLMNQYQKITALHREKLQALKNADIKNAILQQKNTRLTRQLEQLQREYKNLSSNSDKHKTDLTKILNYQAEIKYFKESNQSLKEELKRFEQKSSQHRIQIERISRDRDEYRNTSNNAMERLATAQEELRRINIKYDDKELELKEARHQTEEKIIMKNNQIKKLEQKLSFIEKQNERNSKFRSELPRVEELVREIQRLQAIELELRLQISNYEEKVALLAQQNERLTMLSNSRVQEGTSINKLKTQIEQRDKRIRDLLRQNQSLSLRQKRYKEDNDSLRVRLRENSANQRQAESWEFKNRQLRDELDVLKTQLNVKEQQLRNIDDRYQREIVEKSSLLRQNEELTSKISISNYPEREGPSREYFENQLRKYTQRAQRDSTKIQQLEAKNSSHDQIYTTFSQQIMRLNKVVGQCTEKIHSYKKQVDFLQHKVKTCQEALYSKKHVQLGSERSIPDSESRSKIDIFEGKIRGYQNEIQILKQRLVTMKQTSFTQESKLNDLSREKSKWQMKANQLEYQVSIKSQNFRTVEDSFKLTIMEIKNSNQRLQHSLRQIENHYISKLESKEEQINFLRREKKDYENQIYQLEKKVSNMQISFGSELNQKNRYINNLNSNNSQTREQIETIKRIKSDYEVKVALLSQQIQRLNSLRQRQNNQIDALRRQLRQNEARYVQSMKDSSYNSNTIETLSQEIQRLNNVVLKNVENIKEQQRKASRLQMEKEQLKRQNREVRQKNEQLERKSIEEKDDFSQRIMKYEEMNKELKFQLQDKSREYERVTSRVRQVEQRQQMDNNNNMKNLYEQLKLLRESNQNLQKKLSVITRQYQQLVQQLEYAKKSKSSAQEDEKSRIIANYEGTIKNMREDNTKLANQRNKYQRQCDQLNKIAHEMQERCTIAEERTRTYEDKCRRVEERLKVIEERTRSQDDILRGKTSDKSVMEQKLVNVMQEMARLQIILQTKDTQIDNLNLKIQQLKQSPARQDNPYYSQQTFTQKKGIFVIIEAAQVQQRSRSASGNNPQAQLLRHPSNPIQLDQKHKYELLESVNKKLTVQMECLRQKNVEYQFKMNKLKEEFDLINRLIHEYRQQNDKLKETNKLLSAQANQRTNNLMAVHSQYSSPQHSTIKGASSHYQREITHRIVQNKSQTSHVVEHDESFATIKAKLYEEIDRLNKVNGSLQGEVHDLRTNSSENISLRKRYEENLGLMVLLFVQIEALRARVRVNDPNVPSPGRK